MLRKHTIAFFSMLSVGSALSANVQADPWLVVVHGNEVRQETLNQIAAAGGQVTRNISQIGVLQVEADENFGQAARAIAGVKHLSSDSTFQFYHPVTEDGVSLEYASNPPGSGDDDFFFDLQWGHDAVNAPEAWNNGITGKGVRVAVIDGGYDLDHPDLAPNIYLKASKDFTGEGLDYSIDDTFSHGSHVAGTIAAADNGFGTIGVAPEATLILLKALRDEGSGSFGDVAAAIVHAADYGADVINMSLGASFPASAEGAAALKVMMSRATTYAHNAGSTIITSAGNDARDGDKDTDTVTLPADSPHVISISATGPRGWAAGSDDLNELAVYSNYGQSLIDFAAPGGDYEYYLTNGTANCEVAGLLRPCGVFDFVFSTGNGGWYWSVGTSMAAPHAAGVAALQLQANGGQLKPAQLESELAHEALDLGKPGNDDDFGGGLVQAPR
ncbi:S8 family serine peptidase [Microbulbifer yueqingensis]|uniref:Subtilase family protein n=1 Tax=Microbulbifer yueqingensis TaxID=658219 RepID=A0A1G8ZZY2_9GAMM|nr:S8 family serine peptidase [Microbulbifer yueqingensis]SDK20682.1 Subtilase family protein [Microbulbifer yueqingensis]